MMSETKPVPEEPTQDTCPDNRQRQFYAPWMIGVLVLFVVCEVLFFTWGYDAAEFAVLGLFLAVLFNSLRCWRAAKPSAPYLEVIVILAVILFVIAMILPAGSLARKAASRPTCMNNIRNLGLAIHNYASGKGHLPPPVVMDEAEHPMHSWRTMILPYIERIDLYEAYDFQKPWNAPENQKVAETEVRIFQCPSVSNPTRLPKARTDYVAVTGPDTAWPTNGTKRSLEEDFTAGTSYTAMLIDINHSDIPWCEPRDIKLEDLLSGKVSWAETSVHTDRGAFYYPVPGHCVVFSDGHVEYLCGDLTPDQLRRLFSITEPFESEKELSYIESQPIVYRHNLFYVWLATLLLQFLYIFFPVKKRRASSTAKR